MSGFTCPCAQQVLQCRSLVCPSRRYLGPAVAVCLLQIFQPQSCSILRRAGRCTHHKQDHEELSPQHGVFSLAYGAGKGPSQPRDPVMDALEDQDGCMPAMTVTESYRLGLSCVTVLQESGYPVSSITMAEATTVPSRATKETNITDSCPGHTRNPAGHVLCRHLGTSPLGSQRHRDFH